MIDDLPNTVRQSSRLIPFPPPSRNFPTLPRVTRTSYPPSRGIEASRLPKTNLSLAVDDMALPSHPSLVNGVCLISMNPHPPHPGKVPGRVTGTVESLSDRSRRTGVRGRLKPSAPRATAPRYWHPSSIGSVIGPSTKIQLPLPPFFSPLFLTRAGTWWSSGHTNSLLWASRRNNFDFDICQGRA